MAFAMVTLSLLRHAKSAWDTPIRSDFERPLARRGIKAARRIGTHVEREELVPELVLCSSALRARETIELAAEAWEKQPEIRYLDRLYHAAPGVILDALRAVPPEVAHVMLVGHNPGIHALAVSLCASGDEDALKALTSKYPTGALAVIDFDSPWQDIGQGPGVLRAFTVPRALK